MSDIGDIDEGDLGIGGPDIGAAALAAGAAAVCLSCGHAVSGPFCATCGQKNDDLRRSSFLLARDFIEDTFSFDGRMWRTLWLMAAAPGVVPKEYAHGRRSQFTPPVRLFLVVSFLFFLTIGLTKTLFVALEVKFNDESAAAPIAVVTFDAAGGGTEAVAADPDAPNCKFSNGLRFFVKERNLVTDKERLDACFTYLNERVRENAAAAAAATSDSGADASQASQLVNRIFGGLEWAIANPREFNDSFNDWLPRVLLFMTPVLALILIVFIRREALIFDHLVLAFYTHAAGFSIIGLSLILAQLGAPQMGVVAFLALSVYYAAAG